MVCLGLKPGVAVWKSQMNPLSYGGIPEALCSYPLGKEGHRILRFTE